MSDWESVRIVGTEEEAALICGFLESEGVVAIVDSQLFHQEPVTFGGMGEIHVRVPADQVEAALRLLAGRDASSAQPAGDADSGDSGPV